MDARIRRPSWGLAALCATLFTSLDIASAQYGHPAIYVPQPTMVASPGMQPQFIQGMSNSARGPRRGMAGGAAMAAGAHAAGQSENFLVLCNDPSLTQAVSEAAERLRRELAIHWLGEELPNWSRRCPLQVTSGPSLGAGGETRFSLYNGNVGDWNMSVQGTPERILDSVLPHEITHTIFASHFAVLNAHVPRWADEGACTTVEHDSEQNKHKSHLIQYLSTGRGLSFNRMFSLKDYPRDILPLYAQGHSVVEFLIAQGGPRKFVKFLEDGMQSQQWEAAIRRAYDYETLGQLQMKWNQWIADGRGPVESYVANPEKNAVAATLASNAQPANVPSLDASPSEAGDELAGIEEGSSVALISAGGASVDLAATKLGDSSKSASVDAPTASSGFYRQRLEGKLRDIVHITPAKTAANTPPNTPANVAANTAANTPSRAGIDAEATRAATLLDASIGAQQPLLR